MFAKLLKMEFRSTWNVLGILCLSLVGAGLLGGVSIRYLVSEDAPKQWLMILCTLAIVAAVLFFVVCCAAALIVQIVRFYRGRAVLRRLRCGGADRADRPLLPQPLYR